MLKHRTEYRVIYGDTDRMGVAYYGHYPSAEIPEGIGEGKKYEVRR